MTRPMWSGATWTHGYGLEERPQLEAQSGHQQVGLVARLAVEGDELVVQQLLAQPLVDEADLGWADGVEAAKRSQRHDHQRPEDDE